MDTVPSTRTFGLFSSLPLELQDLIWEFSCAQEAPRIFQWRNDFLYDDSKDDRPYLSAMHCHPPPYTQHPVTQQVCFRAREAAIRCGLRSISGPFDQVDSSWDMNLLMSGGLGLQGLQALPLSSVRRRNKQHKHGEDGEIQYLFNIKKDILFIQNAERPFPTSNATSTTSAQALPEMLLADAHHIAMDIPQHFDTFTSEYWECGLSILRSKFKFKSVKTLYLVHEDVSHTGSDTVTGSPRERPWLRDGCSTEGFETLVAPITSLENVTCSCKCRKKWKVFQDMIGDVWAGVCINAGGDGNEVKVAPSTTVRDCSPRPKKRGLSTPDECVKKVGRKAPRLSRSSTTDRYARLLGMASSPAKACVMLPWDIEVV